jgi:mannose-6-phosphate isomerase-like protein (cupin superfamily)
MNEERGIIMDKKAYSILNYGPMENWDNFIIKVPEVVAERTGVSKVPGKRFAKEDLGLEYMDFSINKLVPGMELPFIHKHTKQEELFFFLKGEGEMYIDGEILSVHDGTAICVSPSAKRTLRNTKLTEPLYYLCFRAQGGKIDPNPKDVQELEIFEWGKID